MALMALLFTPLPAWAGKITFTSVASGYTTGYGVGSDGNIYAWGYNGSGQLGNNANTSSPVPVQVIRPAGVTFTAVAAGASSAYGLGSDGNIYAWGSNGSGALGNNSTVDSPVPVQVDASALPAGALPFTAVTASYNTGYGLGSDGNIYAWGMNSNGQLGNNSTDYSSLVPVQVIRPTGVTFTAVASCPFYTGFAYGLGSDGNIYAWGSNSSGQLGNNSTTDSPVPVRVDTSALPAGVTFTAVASGYSTGYGLGSDGNIYAWGGNNSGALGNNSTDSYSLVPVQVDTSTLPAGVTFTGAAGGQFVAYGLGSDGNIYAWGTNDSGQLGNNSTDYYSPVPVQVSASALPAGVLPFTAVASYANTGYGLGSNGDIYAWGWNNSGQLGNNTTTDSPVPVLVLMPDYGISLSEMGTHTFAAATVGYATPPSGGVTVSNVGEQDTGALALALSGADSDKFELSATSLSNLTATGAGSSTVFTVSPAPGLAIGTYTASVTVGPATGNTNPIAPQTFFVRFTVSPPRLTQPATATPVPTLGQWALALLGLLLAGSAAVRRRGGAR